MTANVQPIFALTPKFGSIAIANSDAQTVKSVYTAGANGGRVSGFSLISTDTAARDVGIFINGVLIGTVSVPAGSGTSSSLPAKDVLADLNVPQSYYDAHGNQVIDIPATMVVGINAPVTVTSAKTITGAINAGDF